MDRIADLAQKHVWGVADHECGGLWRGSCKLCDQRAATLADNIKRLFDSLNERKER